MKILQIHNRYRLAGGEDVCVADERRMLEKRGHRVIPYERDNHEIREGSVTGQVGLALDAVWSRRTSREIERLVASEKPDVAHVHNTHPLVSPSVYWALSAAAVPVVQTLHNYRLLCPPGTLYRAGGTCQECPQHSLLRAVKYRCYRDSRGQSAVVAATLAVHRTLGTWRSKVDLYIALTEFSRNLFVRAGIPADRIVLKPNFLGQAVEPRYDHDGYAVFMGRLTPEKGIETLLATWKLGVNMPIRVIGDGPLRSSLLERVQREGIRGVEYLGALPHEEGLRQLRGAAFLFVPSVWYEGLPRVVVEAYACGKPVIASRLGSLSELVVDGSSGFLFEPGDAGRAAQAVRATGDEQKRLEMGRAARVEFEQHYTEDRNYKLLMDIYARAGRKQAHDMSSGSTARA